MEALPKIIILASLRSPSTHTTLLLLLLSPAFTPLLLAAYQKPIPKLLGGVAVHGKSRFTLYFSHDFD